MPETGQTYFIVNKKSGTAFALSAEDRRSIIGFTPNKGDDNQKWIFRKEKGEWTIQNRRGGMYVDTDVPNISSDGVRIVVITTANPRTWTVIQDQSGDGWRVFYPGTKQNFDLSDNGNPTPGTPVTFWSETDGENQVWRLEKAH